VSAPGGPRERVVLACDFHRHYSAMLCGAFDRAGVGATLLTRDHDLEFGGVPGASRAFIDEAAGPNVELRTIDGRVRSARGWRQALTLRRELRRDPPDYIHLQDAISNDVRLLVPTGTARGRFALTVHDPVKHPGDVPQIFLRDLSERRLIARAGLIFVHAEALREELEEINRPKGAVVVIPHGVDPAPAVPLPARPSVVFFGRISHYKGLDVLLDAMERVWRELPEATLTIAGKGEIAPHGALEDRRVSVRAGHLPEEAVPDLIQSASCVALPYRQASQSGVGSRVKAYGRPLLVTDLGGLPELVSDGSGLVVPPEDPDAMAAALVRILSEPGLAQRLGDAAAETAEREGSWDTVAELTLAAYREHLGGR
jgi:glycosyltransferase involved in cell wall biosynthesis